MQGRGDLGAGPRPGEEAGAARFMKDEKVRDSAQLFVVIKLKRIVHRQINAGNELSA